MNTRRVICLALLACLPMGWSPETSKTFCEELDQIPELHSSEPKDPWFRQLPIELIIDPIKKTDVKWRPVEPECFHRVTREKWSKAEAMLEKQWFYRLTPDQAKEFVGKVLPKSSDKIPYLVPALYYERGPGEFHVATLHKYLWIRHYSFGSRSAAMRRDALVVFLKTEPVRLFVTCGRTV